MKRTYRLPGAPATQSRSWGRPLQRRNLASATGNASPHYKSSSARTLWGVGKLPFLSLLRLSNACRAAAGGLPSLSNRFAAQTGAAMYSVLNEFGCALGVPLGYGGPGDPADEVLLIEDEQGEFILPELPVQSSNPFSLSRVLDCAAEMRGSASPDLALGFHCGIVRQPNRT